MPTLLLPATADDHGEQANQKFGKLFSANYICTQVCAYKCVLYIYIYIYVYYDFVCNMIHIPAMSDNQDELRTPNHRFFRGAKLHWPRPVPRSSLGPTDPARNQNTRCYECYWLWPQSKPIGWWTLSILRWGCLSPIDQVRVWQYLAESHKYSPTQSIL